MNTQIYIPTRNEILSLSTESFENSTSNYLQSNLYNNVIESELLGGRDKPSAGDVFHQETIEYLKNEMKLPEIEARAYKSIAYRKVKEMHPEANHLERAKLMLEMVKHKNFVKENKDRLAEVVKILEDIDAKKAEKQPETETKLKRSRRTSRKSSRKSRKSSRKSQRGGNNLSDNLSETSVMQNYTESNANQPYYKEYMQAKNQYLQTKLQNSQHGGRILSINSIEALQNFINENQHANISATIMLK